MFLYRARGSDTSRSRAYRGSRGGYRGQWDRPSQRPTASPPEPPSPQLGLILATIDRNEIRDGETDLAKITDCTDVASYNWLNRKEATVLIPGKPVAWTPLSSPIKLREDDGEYFRDQNAARYLSHPLHPAVEAIFKQKPDLETKEIDIVGCGSTLGNLLRFSRGVDKKFRMLVEVIGSTVFLVRRENLPTQNIPDVRGNEHTFLEAYTTWDEAVKGSESHQCVVQYSFGGLRCLVRFEADGYLPDLAPSTSKSDSEKEKKTEAVNQLLPALEENSVSSSKPKNSALNVQTGGSNIPKAALFDLKTRASRRRNRDFLAEKMPRLWASQIPNFVLAFHDFGVFNGFTSGCGVEYSDNMIVQSSDKSPIRGMTIYLASNQDGDC